MMEVDSDNALQLLRLLAQGEEVHEDSWPAVRRDILARLDKIAHHDFPIPDLPPPRPRPAALQQQASPLPSSPTLEPDRSQDSDKENAATAVPQEAAAAPAQTLAPGALPVQITDMLEAITAQLQRFETHPPHTIQRVAELILSPRAHYKALASYLHALDRVVQVTSGTNVYPLPPAVPDMSTMANGDEAKNPAAAVAWGNSTINATAQTLGTDEALGGALLTPIPWLTRRSPESNGSTPGAQIHSESTETIDGPNGMGSIETVSVSVNGVPSTGHARGVTQGELLRQEQRAGVVPVSQLSRTQEMQPTGECQTEAEDEEEDDEEAAPTHGGPEEIGVGDTGPQPTTTAYGGEGAMEAQGIDVEAAVGRKHDDQPPDEEVPGSESTPNAGAEPAEPSSPSPGTKREAEQDLSGDAVKKVKEGDAPETSSAEEAARTTPGDGTAATQMGSEDKMETDKGAE